MDKRIKIAAEISEELFCEINALATELSLSREEIIELLLERSMHEKILSENEKNMIKGYAEMGTINKQMADEAVISDNEAMCISEEYLAGV